MRLLLTLGHNASAILEKDNKVLCGYEEERLSGVKADSSFPVLSINKILEYYPEVRYDVTEVCVSHWFWSFDVPEESKYWKPKYISVNFPEAKVIFPDYYNTHHDLHAKSVWNFLDGDDTGLTIVADGFGNKGECLSLYSEGVLTHRSYAIEYSLGLMYQYAIGYLGMKENQDEYKLLGYEQQVQPEFKVNNREKVEELIEITYNGLMTKTRMIENTMSDTLNMVRYRWYTIFDSFSDFGADKPDRPKVAWIVQTILEGVMMNIVSSLGEKNIKVSGGVFYNVKLNNAILRYSDKFEAHPLAGDQGAALGYTDARYETLYWGKRNCGAIKTDKVVEDLCTLGYAEIMTGNMEFGPRALCNTTTLAKPTLKMVETINAMNGRDTVMPMAPVVTEWYAKTYFRDTEKVAKSKYFMVIAFDYIAIDDSTRGAAHYDSDRDVYTGRIQVSNSYEINGILDVFGGILINTSLNAHGQPILYNDVNYGIMKHIQASHK